jgi:hypothetical protein
MQFMASELQKTCNCKFFVGVQYLLNFVGMCKMLVLAGALIAINKMQAILK